MFRLKYPRLYAAIAHELIAVPPGDRGPLILSPGDYAKALVDLEAYGEWTGHGVLYDREGRPYLLGVPIVSGDVPDRETS